METFWKWAGIVSAIVAVIAGAKWVSDATGFSENLRKNAYLEANKVCISSHEEQYAKQPLSVVAGGGKYGGGVAIPLGDIEIKTRTVCDAWEYPPMPY